MARELCEQECIALEAWIHELEAPASPAALARAGLLRRALEVGAPLGRAAAQLAAGSRPQARLCTRVSPEPWICEGLQSDAEAGPSAAPGTEVVEFDSEPRMLSVNSAFMLNTRLGAFLRRRNLINAAVFGTALVLCVVSVWEPLSEDLPESGALHRPLPNGGVLKLRIRREGILVWLLRSSSSALLWFLMMHNMNRDLFFRALCTFDALVILSSFAIGMVAEWYNIFDCWASEGYYDTVWFVFDIVDVFVMVIPAGLVMATMDSWKILAWVHGDRLSYMKILLAVIAMVYYFKLFVDMHLHTETTSWSERPICLWGLCSSSKEIFGSATLQKIIFLGKLVVKYLLGFPFGFIRPRYTRHDAFEDRAISKIIEARSAHITSGVASVKRAAGSEFRRSISSARSGSSWVLGNVAARGMRRSSEGSEISSAASAASVQTAS